MFVLRRTQEWTIFVFFLIQTLNDVLALQLSVRFGWPHKRMFLNIAWKNVSSCQKFTILMLYELIHTKTTREEICHGQKAE